MPHSRRQLFTNAEEAGIGAGLSRVHASTEKRRFSSAAGTAPHECADRQRAAALVGAGVSAGAEPGREANPRRRLRRGKRKQRSGNGKYGECRSHLAPFEALGPVLRARAFLSVSFGELRAQVRSAVAVPPTFCACRHCGLALRKRNKRNKRSSEGPPAAPGNEHHVICCTTVGICGAAARRWHHELESL